MLALANLFDTLITLAIWVLIASAVLSWLVTFNVVNTRNRAVYLLGDLLHRLTEPLLRPIRQRLPSLGGLDLSPLVVILFLVFVRDLFHEYVRPF